MLFRSAQVPAEVVRQHEHDARRLRSRRRRRRVGHLRERGLREQRCHRKHAPQTDSIRHARIVTFAPAISSATASGVATARRATKLRAVNPPSGRVLPALLALALVFGAACSHEPAHAGLTLDQWLADASSDDATARARAIDAFREWGDEGVDELLKAIRAAGSRVEDADTEEGRRAQRAFNVLMQLSPDQRAATDALVKLLNEYYTAEIGRASCRERV